MEKDVDQLKKLRFFDEFDDHMVEKIINRSDIKEFIVKDVIIEEYQELSELYVLIEGKVILGINTPKKGRINLNTIHPGQIFSWSAMFPPHISTAYAVATEPVQALAIKAAKMKQMIKENPSFGYTFMSIIGRTLSQRLADTRFQLVNIISL
ncbi:MAG: cyclic nucleotide-binding domain-containing protein [Bacteroidota bacterium]